MQDLYQELAKKLDDMPNGYPPTENGVELKILKKIFTPEEAEFWLKLKLIPETAGAIAERLGATLGEIQSKLDNMAVKGQIASIKVANNQVYMQMPFIIGIFEFQLNRIDKELADLVEEYAPELMSRLGGFTPSLTRVVPVNATIDAQHQTHRYEDVKLMLEKAKSFQLQDCICRKEAALQGHPCKHSVEVCLGLSFQEDGFEKYSQGRIVSREEAMQVMAKAEEEGLVHTTYNVKSDHMYVCNCCSCCCGILRGIKYFNAPYLMAKSNFVALIDRDECAACGVCADERCPMKAIVEEDGSYKVLPERCIGCGVCTKTCPTGAIGLIAKSEGERDEPPANLMEWAGKRAEARGIKIIV